MTKQQADDNARDIYTKTAYVLTVALELCDKLRITNQFRHQLKHALNIACKEMEKITRKHFEGMENMGFIELNGNKIHGLEMYKTAGDAYELLFEFITEREAADVVVLAELIKNYDENKAKETVVTIDSMNI